MQDSPLFSSPLLSTPLAGEAQLFVVINPRAAEVPLAGGHVRSPAFMFKEEAGVAYNYLLTRDML